MRVALIGIGRWGKILLKELKSQAEVSYECDSETDLKAVFSDESLRAVFIATPTDTHYGIAKLALEHGKHVFIEKPGTTNGSELEDLVSLSEEKGLKLAVGYEYLHHPAVQKIKELMDGKKLEFIRLEYQKWGTFTTSIELNLFCHDVSILKYLGIDTASPMTNKVGLVTQADIMATRFGKNAMSIINRVSPMKSRTMLVKLESASYLWANDDLFKVNGEELSKIEISDKTSVAAEISDFLTSIEEDREPLSNGRFALEIHEVIEAARASAPR